jgi:Ca2+-transporting ATPase
MHDSANPGLAARFKLGGSPVSQTAKGKSHTRRSDSRSRPSKQDPMKWQSFTAQEAALYLDSDLEEGLSYADAHARLFQFGPNTLVDQDDHSPWRTFLAQFKDFMVLMLLAATILAAAMGEVVDAMTIATIVFLNAALGFIQEYKAERALEALSALSAPHARVVRNMTTRIIPAEEVVPGDILLLEAGDTVSADAILYMSNAMEVDESTLTGESIPVAKGLYRESRISSHIGDRSDMVFMGTSVVRGRGKAIVVLTGMETQMGRIAGMIRSSGKEDTPLEKRLESLGRAIATGCLLICLMVAVAGYLRGEEPLVMLFAGISLAVAAIPEGLPTVVTVALSLGVQRMSRGNAIVRRLPAVETLGSTTIVCSDKTGTITKNEMSVKTIVTCGQELDLSHPDFYEWRDFEIPERHISSPWLDLVIRASVLCNNAAGDQMNRTLLEPFGFRKPLRTDARMNKIGISAGLSTFGKRRKATSADDPTEASLIDMAWRLGFDPNAIRHRNKRIGEIPFDPERKLMSVIIKEGRTFVLFAKGAPEAILKRCNFVFAPQGIGPLSEREHEDLVNTASSMAKRALRVLALAYRTVTKDESGDVQNQDIEQDLCFLGFLGLFDPPRPEAVSAIKRCYEAGIRTVMITGDHLNTALAIAAETGIIPSGSDPSDEVDSRDSSTRWRHAGSGSILCLVGSDLEVISDAELEDICGDVRVYARVSPEHKLRIVRALKRRNHIVAMTGDGVNDAPALEEADIGIAMGKSGSEVAKTASDMVLADDNFATIVKAVEEGRAIYDNIKRFIGYLLACNVGEILVMLLATVFGLPLPLLPIQILWVNLVTDGLPALALGLEPPGRDIMMRPPRPVGENLFSGGLGRRIIERGMLIGVSTLGVFAWRLELTGDLSSARTWALATLVVSQLWHAFDCRSTEETSPRGVLRGSLYLVLAIVSSWVLLGLAIYVPLFSGYFRTVPISVSGWGVVTLVGGLGTIGSFIRAAAKPKDRPGRMQKSCLRHYSH